MEKKRYVDRVVEIVQFSPFAGTSQVQLKFKRIKLAASELLFSLTQTDGDNSSAHIEIMLSHPLGKTQRARCFLTTICNRVK